MMFYKDFAAYVEGQAKELEALRAARMPDYGVIVEVLGPSENQSRVENSGGYSVTRTVDSLTTTDKRNRPEMADDNCRQLAALRSNASLSSQSCFMKARRQ